MRLPSLHKNVVEIETYRSNIYTNSKSVQHRLYNKNIQTKSLTPVPCFQCQMFYELLASLSPAHQKCEILKALCSIEQHGTFAAIRHQSSAPSFPKTTDGAPTNNPLKKII